MTLPTTDKILILTPVKDAADCLDRYFQLIQQLTYPRHLLSLGFLESDSMDNTFGALNERLLALEREFKFAGVWKKDFGYRIPAGHRRWDREIQIERRTVLAKSRNYLLFRALTDQDWALWMDVDLIEYPPGIIERLLATGKEIIQPNCVLTYGGQSYDQNAWRDKGQLHLHDLRHEGDVVKLHAVGGTMLLIKADIHRQGLIFPPFLYGGRNPLVRSNHFLSGCVGEIETEGLGMMAYDMGYECWGMPNLEIKHRDG